MPFDPRYVTHVLGENFRDAKALFIEPLLSIQYAHLVMLSRCGIVSSADAHALRVALDGIPAGDVRALAFDGTCEDLFFHLERLVTAACGDDVAGRLHTARSRNDIDMTMYRMRHREFIATLIDGANALRQVLLDLAARHGETVFAAHTHTQPAQPTTLAHYLLAIVEQLERDVRRLRAAYITINRCPLGACAITGTGFPIDRQLTSDLLGFDAPTGNTYGSIAAVDHLLEGTAAAATLLAGLGRVLQDLLLWCTPEFGYLRLADGFVQCSSIMPQKRNPVALEHARAIASKALGQAQAVVTVVHNTPFGDIVDTEDDLQPLVAALFHDASRALDLAAAALQDAQFDTRRLEERAGRGGTTLTELADHLVREHDLPFRTAHAIASALRAAYDGGTASSPAALLASVSRDLIGAPLQYTDSEIATIMSPRHFVDVRNTPGGPAPARTSQAIASARGTLAGDGDWLTDARGRLAASADRLRRESAAL